MAFVKGQSGNPDGKPPGAKNKVSPVLRDMVTAFLEGKFDQVSQNFDKLSPKDQWKVFVDLLKYSVPILQAISTEIEFEKMTDEQLYEIVERLKKSALPHHEHNQN